MADARQLPAARLLIITTNFPRWEGDPHSPWLVELLSLLRQRGLEIEILAPAYGGQGSHVGHGFHVHRFRYAPARWETLTHDEGAPNKIRRNPRYLLLLPGYLLAGALAAARLGRSGDYDILHVHWPMPQGLLGVIARWAGGGRLVATFYGADLVMSKRFRFVQPLVRSFARRCADVAAISSFTAREVERSTGVTPRVIPYGIAMPADDRTWPAQPGMILTVGRLVARKGHIYLIEAMARLKALNAQLVIVGEGHERPDLEEKVRALQMEERVTFAGRVSDSELNRLYQTCQVFVLPAIVDSSGDTEMLGMVSLEAMRYRKPVVATRVGGIADIVQDNATGLMVEQRDADGLAAAIDRLLADPNLASELGQAGYQYARDHFSWQAVMEQTLALYAINHDTIHARTN